MTLEIWITLLVIIAALVLFISELLSVDLVAMLILVTLVVTGVITPSQGLSGFSNAATVTVAFMFVISAAILKTGALQWAAGRLTLTFRNHYQRGVVLLMLWVSLVSAFINNTPVVAVMIPVTTQIAKNSGRAASKLLIPISYASIFGGTCTLIGTSTNILLSGIAEQFQLPAIRMFDPTPMGLVLLVAGSLFMILIGQRLLPNRNPKSDETLEGGLIDYLAELEILENSELAHRPIFSSPLVRELDTEILELRRGHTLMNQPQGDTVLIPGDLLKVRCNVENIKMIKDRLKVNVVPFSGNADPDDYVGQSSFVELVIPANSELEGKSLREFDFRRRFRAAPLAIRQREEVLRDRLMDVRLRAGDVILAEMKIHYLEQHKASAKDESIPFLILSEEGIRQFDRKRFRIVSAIVAGVILLASFELLPIVISTLMGVCALVLTGCLTMKEVYRGVQWNIVFLLAGALSLGMAMEKSGLASAAARAIVDNLHIHGPLVILAGLYLMTSLLTEMMSNNATAALMAPLGIATAQQLGLSPTPFLMAVLFAASASFMTPIGYQTNTMIYAAGGYKFHDFIRVGIWLNLLFFLLAIIFIPFFYPF